MVHPKPQEVRPSRVQSKVKRGQLITPAIPMVGPLSLICQPGPRIG
jgi:hypothetical protein